MKALAVFYILYAFMAALLLLDIILIQKHIGNLPVWIGIATIVGSLVIDIAILVVRFSPEDEF